MPEIFIGTDIVSVPKIKEIIDSPNGEKFIKRIFTENEINYCNGKLNSLQHYSGRFAAKEAITKAILSSENIASIKMNSIEIVSGDNRRPEVNLIEEYNFKYKCKVSISHTDKNAIAFAIFEIL